MTLGAGPELARCVTPFHLDELPPQPWRNGGGTTREILTRQSHALAWDWRVSVADNVRPGAFSTFAGVERRAVLLDGPGLTLHDAHGATRLCFDQPGDTQCFAGETLLHSQLPQGPTRLLNVMTRRGHAQAGTAWHGGRIGTSLGLSEDMACVLLVVGGRWHVRLKAADGAASVAAYELGPDSGLRIVGVPGRLHLQGLQADSTLAQVLLQPA